MTGQLLTFLFSILGLSLSIVNFKKLKKHLNVYSEIFGIVSIIYFLQ